MYPGELKHLNTGSIGNWLSINDTAVDWKKCDSQPLQILCTFMIRSSLGNNLKIFSAHIGILFQDYIPIFIECIHTVQDDMLALL